MHMHLRSATPQEGYQTLLVLPFRGNLCGDSFYIGAYVIVEEVLDSEVLHVSCLGCLALAVRCGARTRWLVLDGRQHGATGTIVPSSFRPRRISKGAC